MAKENYQNTKGDKQMTDKEIKGIQKAIDTLLETGDIELAIVILTNLI